MIITGGGGRGAVFTSLFVSDRCNVVPCHEKKEKARWGGGPIIGFHGYR